MLVGRNYDHKVVEYEVPLAASVYVPADFAGHHFHRWPLADPYNTSKPVTPAPDNIRFGTWRFHDNRAAWYTIETADGQYDWTRMDALVDAATSRNLSVWYTLYGTPQWATLHAADASFNDLYNQPAGAAPPNHAKLGAFLTALIQRYNSGEAKIKTIELWNEPGYSTNHDGFYWGTPVELVEMCKFAYDLIKSLDSRIVVSSPGFNHMIHLHSWANAYSTTTGVYGYETCDVYSYHPYGAQPFSGYYSIIGTASSNVSISAMRKILVEAGATNPQLCISEVGIDGSASKLANYERVFQRFYDASPEYRRDYISRIMLLAAIEGVKSWCWYSYDGYAGNDISLSKTLSGDWMQDNDGVVAGLNRINDEIAGKTIERAWISSTGSIRVIVDGQELIF